MRGKRQFSLAWLLFQVCILGLALGFSRYVIVSFEGEEGDIKSVLRLGAFIGAFTCWGAFLGGFFGRAWYGVLAVWGLFLLAFNVFNSVLRL